MVKTTAASEAASIGDLAAVAPASTSGAVLAGLRFHTVTSCPAAPRFAAMPEPMLPRPRNAMLMG